MRDINKFNLWQNEFVYTSQYGIITINKLLHTFLNDGIFPFIQKNGYTFLISKDYIENSFATILFHLDYNRHYLFDSPKDVSYSDELFNNYMFYPDWENFWKSWNNSTKDFFVDAEIQIQLLFWSCINFEKSTACKEYLEEGDIDDENINKLRNMDPYLLDQLNASNHYKFTRFENS